MSRHRRKRAYRRRHAIRTCYRAIMGEITVRTKAAIDAWNAAQAKRIEAQIKAYLERAGTKQSIETTCITGVVVV